MYLDISLSAGGQLEHPWDVNSSSTTKLFVVSVGLVRIGAATLIPLVVAVQKTSVKTGVEIKRAVTIRFMIINY